MVIQGGTSYFTLDYVNGYPTRLPELFRGPLNDVGTGVVALRYGGKRIPIVVTERELQKGWKTFVKHSKVKVGAILLAAYSGGRIISIIGYNEGMGMNAVWDMNGDVYDVDSELVEEDEFPRSILPEAVRTCYFPRYVPLFFARPSGFCVFEQCRYNAMAVPPNLAQHMRSTRRTKINIRSGNRVFTDIEFGMGYFRGDNWRHMIEDCEFQFGFKMFFFTLQEDEFEMIVIGHGDIEAVYSWARSYYKL